MSLAALAGCGGSKPKPKVAADPLAQALAFVPTQAKAVAAVATDPNHGQGAAATNLLERFVGADVVVSKARERIKTALGLSAGDELGPLLGNDLVLADTASGPLGAWVVSDEPDLRALLSSQVTRHALARRPSAGGYALYARAGVLVAAKGAVVVAGATAAVRDALAARARGAGMTTALFRERLRGLPADALLLVEGNLALAARTQGSKLAWVKALNRFALTVRADAAGVHARLRAATSPVAPADVPLAPGAAAPAPLARPTGLLAGLHDLRQLVRFGLRAAQAANPSAYRRYDLARRALRLLRRADIDRDVIDQLGGTTTFWSPDLRTFALTAPVPDPGRMARALKNLRPLMGRLLGAAGIAGASVSADAAPGAYRVHSGGRFVARYGVAGGTFVFTTSPLASLPRLAAGRPAPIGSLSGALTGVVRGAALRHALIVRLGLPAIASLALGALGDATFEVRTATGGVEAAADVSIR